MDRELENAERERETLKKRVHKKTFLLMFVVFASNSVTHYVLMMAHSITVVNSVSVMYSDRTNAI